MTRHHRISSKSRREGEVYFTKSIDFACYLIEMTPMVLIEGYPRRVSESASVIEWAFDDPADLCDTDLFQQFLNSEYIRVSLRRSRYLRKIHGRKDRGRS